MQRALILVGFIIAMTAASVPANAAQEWPWCANMEDSEGGAGINCGFANLAQCRAYISGVGGRCQRNPYYRPEPSPSRRR